MVVTDGGIDSRESGHFVFIENHPFLLIGCGIQLLNIFDTVGKATQHIKRQLVRFILSEKPCSIECNVVFFNGAKPLRQFRILFPNGGTMFESGFDEQTFAQRILKRSAISVRTVNMSLHTIVSTDLVLGTFSKTAMLPHLRICPIVVIRYRSAFKTIGIGSAKS